LGIETSGVLDDVMGGRGVSDVVEISKLEFSVGFRNVTL
jgi:hypothetical protein